ncbi:MFS transporter [Hydrocarboniphaga sp.]|uniref:MFS transporter n=1 Tax=Hydrocarboniphaga sp. TaxID=2033016 RepID=UPI003D142C4F
MSTSNSAFKEWRQFGTLPVAAAIGYSTAVLHTYGIGAFVAPLQQEFGWSRAQISGGITIAGLAGAALSIPIGLLVDRLGPRIVGLIGVLLMTGAFAMLGTATGSTANWLGLWCLIAFANLWLQATVWTSAVGSRFEQSRGLAFAITLSGASLSAAVFPVLSTALIGAYGWRNAFAAMGGIWAAVVLPVMLLFFRGAQDGPLRRSVASRAAAGALPGVSVREGLRSPAFYRLLLASGLFTFTALGIVVHFVPILKDRGADPLAAAGVASLVGLFSLLGRLGTGFLLDRLPAHRVGAAVFLLPIVASALLYFDGANPLSQSLAAAAFGLTLGAEVDVIAYLTSRHFGLKHFGVLFGAITGALALGSAFGPLAAGAAFDHYGGYAPFLLLTMALMALSSLALATLGRPRFVAPHAVRPE